MAHSLDESLRSIIVKKSIHSADMVTEGSLGSLFEKNLAHILKVVGLGVLLLAFPILSPVDALAQVKFSKANGSTGKGCLDDCPDSKSDKKIFYSAFQGRVQNYPSEARNPVLEKSLTEYSH